MSKFSPPLGPLSGTTQGYLQDQNHIYIYDKLLLHQHSASLLSYQVMGPRAPCGLNAVSLLPSEAVREGVARCINEAVEFVN